MLVKMFYQIKNFYFEHFDTLKVLRDCNSLKIQYYYNYDYSYIWEIIYLITMIP